MVPTLTFGCLFAFLVLGQGRRQLLWFAVTRHPTAEWLAQQIVEAFPWNAAPAFVITAGPLSTIQPGQIGAFVPAYATAIFVIDLMTAVLLFAQFSILRSRALLAIASGYLYTALIVIPWMLTFPGVFTPGGLLGAGLQTTNWLYALWHAGFPMFVIAYALLKDATGSPSCGSLSVERVAP